MTGRSNKPKSRKSSSSNSSSHKSPGFRANTPKRWGTPRRNSDGSPVLFEAVTELPPVIELDPTNPFAHLPPERDVSGAIPSDEAPSEEQSEQSGLGTRVAKGVSLTLATTLWTQALGVARTVVLARLLTQADFGVAAMALTVIGGLYTFTNHGVVASVISSRFKDDNELHRYVNLVWTLEIIRGVLISLLLLALAVPFSHFYGEPRLTPMLVALALTPLCTSFQNVGLYLNSRRVEMKTLTLHSFFSNTTGVVITLLLAVLTRNYWALVWGQVLGAFVTTASSFLFSSFRPRLGWDRVLSRRAFDFGKHQFVIGLADYALTTMDNVIVGYLLGKEILGVYVVAYSFCTMARTLVNNAFNTVLFPAFASAGREDDPSRLRALVERAFTLGTLALLVLLTPLVAFAPAVLRVFYGTKWSAAVLPMRLLLLAGFFAGLLSLFSAFFVGLDRPKLESKGKIWDAILFLVILYPLTLRGNALGLGSAGAALTGIIAWAGAATWRWKWANDLAPGALARLPYLLASALGVGALTCALGVLPWAKNAGGWWQSFDLTTPSLVAAWTQLLIGAPLVSVGCIALFSLLHPVARREVATITTKIKGKLRRA